MMGDIILGFVGLGEHQIQHFKTKRVPHIFRNTQANRRSEATPLYPYLNGVIERAMGSFSICSQP